MPNPGDIPSPNDISSPSGMSAVTALVLVIHKQSISKTAREFWKRLDLLKQLRRAAVSCE